MSVRYLNSTKKRLGDYLVELGFITEQQLDAALKEQKGKGGKLGTILIQLGFLSEDVLLAILGKQSGVGYVSLAEYGDISPDAIRSVPSPIARNQLLIPIKKEGNVLTIAIADPLNVFATDDLKALTGCDIKMVVAGESEIKVALDKYYSNAKPEAPAAKRAPDYAPSTNGEDPAVTLANGILLDAVRQGASEIHIEPHKDQMLVRLRLDGVLKTHSTPPKEMHSSLVSRLKVLADMDISERRLPQDGRARIQAEGRDMDVRMTTIPTAYGERAVVKLMDSAEVPSTLEKLGMTDLELETFRNFLKGKSGLGLIAGRSASGKSMTLYAAAIAAVADPTASVMAVEDPVRQMIPGVSQVQAKDDIGLTMAASVRAFVRQEADVILVGELNDRDAMRESAHAALSGRLVLGGIFAQDAAAAIARVVESGIEPALAAQALRVVIGQRMLRRVCDQCKKETDVTGADLQALGGTAADKQRYKIYASRGCPACRQTGFLGRVPAFELVTINEEIYRLIVAQAPASELRAAIRVSGTASLRNAAVRLAISGLTTLDEVVRVTDEEDAHQRGRK